MATKKKRIYKDGKKPKFLLLSVVACDIIKIIQAEATPDKRTESVAVEKALTYYKENAGQSLIDGRKA